MENASLITIGGFAAFIVVAVGASATIFAALWNARREKRLSQVKPVRNEDLDDIGAL